MPKRLSKKDVQRSSCVFWAHADNALSSKYVRFPYSKQRLRELLTLGALFARRLCVQDLSLLNNSSLRELLMADGYGELLENQILVPMLRTNVQNFRELDMQARADPTTYGLLEADKLKPFASFLDEKTSAILPMDSGYFRDVLTANFESSLLNSAFLAAAGLSDVEPQLWDFVKTHRKKQGSDFLRRSVFFSFADALAEAGSYDAASKVKLLSSAILNNTFFGPFDLRPAFPHTYSRALLEIVVDDPRALRVKANYVDADPFREVSLRSADISLLSANDIVALRSCKEAKYYFEMADKAARETHAPEAGAKLRQGLSLYLPMLGAELGSIRAGTRKTRKRAHNVLRLIEWTGLWGGIGLGLATLSAPAWLGVGVGTVWALGLYAAGSKASWKTRKEDLQATYEYESEQWNRLRSQDQQKPVIAVSEQGPQF